MQTGWLVLFIILCVFWSPVALLATMLSGKLATSVGNFKVLISLGVFLLTHYPIWIAGNAAFG